MKLFYSPGACSLAAHIIAREANVELKIEKVDLKTKKTETGRDFTGINPKGYVPALELDDGQILTENPAVLQYIADQRPNSGLLPGDQTMERYRILEMLGYINSEIHKSYAPLFNPKVSPEVRQERIVYLQRRYDFIERALEGKPFAVGDKFSVADAYLFTVTNWAGHLDVDLTAFANVQAFQKRIAGRPAVQEAMRGEGLIK